MTPTQTEDRVSATTAVDTYRKSARALRRLNGSTRATINAHFRHGRTMDSAWRSLVDGGHKALVGLLTEEEALLNRIAEIKQYGSPARPELDGRLRSIRSDITDICKATDR